MTRRPRLLLCYWNIPTACRKGNFQGEQGTQEEIASTAQKAISTRDEERAKKRRLAAHFFSRYLSSQVTCEDGWCIAFVPCPVHVVVFSLKPAADVCVVEITTRVILAVNFIRAIPAVISKVAQLSPRNTRFVTAAIHRTMEVGF